MGSTEGYVMRHDSSNLSTAPRNDSGAARPARRADDAREVLWTVCHELANQLGVMRLFTQRLLARVQHGEAPAEDEWADAMLRIDRVALAAAGLMKDVLGAERDESGPHAGAELSGMMDFDQALDDALAVNGEALSRAGCSVVVSRDPGLDRIRGPWNRSSVERVLSNLLQNVARHAPASTARIHLSIEPGWLHVEFSDGGRGLPGAKVDFGRRPFLEPGAAGSQHGLGLWIIHRTVAALDGDIEMHDAPGSGLAFDIRLPMAAG
jgi:signal transduction histidine kinase